MKAYYFNKQECKNCKHIWFIISDRPIHWLEYYAWLIGVKYEHGILIKNGNCK